MPQLPVSSFVWGGRELEERRDRELVVMQAAESAAEPRESAGVSPNISSRRCEAGSDLPDQGIRSRRLRRGAVAKVLFGVLLGAVGTRAPAGAVAPVGKEKVLRV
jgi:hypothetical protein